MSECSQSGSDVRPITHRQGDRFGPYAYTLGPVEGSTVTSPDVQAQVRTRPANEIVHDFGAIALDGPDGDGLYTYFIGEDDTADWPLGQLNLAIRVYTDETGWKTVVMRPITCTLAGVVEVAP